MTISRLRPCPIVVRRRRSRPATATLILASLVPAIGAPPRAAPDRIAMGAPVFDKACGACHQIGLSAANGVGPRLNGIIDAPAANQRGYVYSPAMRKSAVIWTKASFLAFIADPTAAMPGTRMPHPAVASEADREAIYAYVGAFRADGTLR